MSNAVALPSSYLPKAAEKTSEFEYANLLAETLPPIRTIGKRWVEYGAGVWSDVARDKFRPKAQDILPPSVRSARIEKILLDHLEGRWQLPDEDIFRGAVAFDDTGAVLVNAQNGIVRVAPGVVELLPHDRERMFTRSVQSEFEMFASFELFAKTLEQCLPDPEDRELFQLCCGNFLFPDCRYEVALVCYGGAGSGKSTIAGAVEGTLGDGLTTHLTMSQICDPKCYSLPKLRYGAVNLGTELDSLEVGESGNFKTIVSGEPIEARPIYGEPFTMHSHCKLWFLANGLPRFRNGTEAELRRTRFLHFTLKPERPDVTLKGRLELERPGVLNFMLAGLQKLMTLPAMPLGGRQSQEVHERFAVSNDPVGAFVSRHCTLDPNGRVRKESLVNEFKEFCEQQNLSQILGDHFLKKLYERHTELEEVRPRMNGERVRFVQGIQLKSPFSDE